MSGLCGWIGGANEAPEETLARMAAALPGHGPCDNHRMAGPTAGLALRSVAGTGHWHVGDGLWVAMEGYPRWSRQDLADEARARGHAAALAQAYRERGAAALEDLEGSASCAILEPAKERAVLAIDRFGVWSLCFSRVGNSGLVFATTTDSVRAHPRVAATVSPQTVFDYLYFIDRIPAPRTVYDEQDKLLPGECLVLEDGGAERRTYWEMPYGDAMEAPRADLAAELRERLKGAVGRSLEAEDLDRVGTFLSGGLDSTTVLGLLAEAGASPARAFTIGFRAKRFDESAYARLAVRHFGAEHDLYYLEPDDVVDAIPAIAQIYDEPFANSSAVPAYVCARRARDAGVDVMLAGDGGDELFAGNERYVKDRVFDFYGRLPLLMRKLVIEPLATSLRADGRVLGKGVRYVRQARKSVAVRLTADNVFATEPPENIFAPDALAEIDTARPLRFVDEIYATPRSPEKLHRMLYLDLRLTLADSDLRKVCRMCELAGVRVRYPFLDRELAEFSARVPPQVMLPKGQLRGFYKKAMEDLLPAEIISKPKHGFGMPYVDMVASHAPLRDLACDSLAVLKDRGYFRAAYLDSLIDAVGAGKATRAGGVVWDLMMLGQWFVRHERR